MVENNNSGWIQLHRQLLNNPLWQERREFSKAEAWIDILLNVQHSPDPQEVVIGNTVLYCYRGQSLKSLDTWAERWGITKSKSRRFVKLFQDMNMIRIENETKTTRITVLNYDTYNNSRHASETQVKRKRNASETQVTPDNNGNNENNVKNTPHNPPKGTRFDEFWQAYPKKVDKKKCRKKWKAKRLDDMADTLIADIQTRMAKDAKWLEGYIPNPLTYLNGERWEDEVEIKKNKKQPANEPTKWGPDDW